MANVGLRSVLGVLEELLDQFVQDIAQKRVLQQKFRQHLENEEQYLLADLTDLDDAHITYTKMMAAKRRLEDACFSDIAAVSGSMGLSAVYTVRKLYEKDLIARDVESDFRKDENPKETTHLLSSETSKDKWDVFVSKYVPIIKWTKNYSWREDLRGDLFAGCTVAFMTFPQAMGYAMLAGLPPIYGLYSSFMPVLTYAIFGTSAEMCVGPAAMVSLMIPDTILPLAAAGSSQYMLYAIFLSFLSGLILFLAGVINAGFIVENILSVPLLTGWIQGAAILIVLSQLSSLFAIKIPSTSNSLVSVLQSIIEELGSTNGWSMLIGSVCLILLFGSRKLGERKFPIIKKLPISLLVLAGVTALSKILDWENRLNLAVIGEIPQGLPSPGFFPLEWNLIVSSIKAALAISIIGFMEGISLAKKFAALRKYRIDVSQELRALGLANMVGSLFSAFPVTGSVTRTSVNYQSGSRTTYSSVVNGFLVGCVLLFLSPLFYYTPRTALSSIVISAGLSLIDIEEIMFLWKIRAKYDLAQLVFIFAVTLFTGPEVGAVVAILVSVLQIVYRSTRPNCVTLGPVSGTTVYKMEKHATYVAKKGILVVRLESNLYFYTTPWLKEKMHHWVSASPTKVSAVVFDCSEIEAADATGVHGLQELIEEYQKSNICIFFSNLKMDFLATVELSGLFDKVGSDSIFGTTHEAVEAAETISYSQRRRLNHFAVGVN